jgi:hypothetical protein
MEVKDEGERETTETMEPYDGNEDWEAESKYLSLLREKCEKGHVGKVSEC